MTIPYRGQTGHGTYFVSASTCMKRCLLQSERTATLLIEVLRGYREQEKYLLHEFAVMPNHFHLLITPTITLERSMQLIKGGFSFRAKRGIGMAGEIWQTSSHDHRVRDPDDYARCREYIHQNPVRKGLAARPEDFPYSSANPKFELDEVPQRLKPGVLWLR